MSLPGERPTVLYNDPQSLRRADGRWAKACGPQANVVLLGQQRTAGGHPLKQFPTTAMMWDTGGWQLNKDNLT
jgi:hypothetical protein